jgi:Tol biopolymer transport system component
MAFLGEDNPLTGTSGIILSESAAQGSVIRFIPLPGIYLSETNNPLERKTFPPCSIRQLTKSSDTELQLGRASFSESGNTVVFSSTGDPVDENPDGNEELFLLRQGDRRPVQLTDTGTGRNQYPVVSPDGRWVMYRSDADGIGGGLGQAVLVLMDLEQGSSRVLPGILAFPGNFDGTGQQLTYTAAGNPLGSNPGGNREIYLFDLGSETLSQLTNSSIGANFSPRLSSDGSRFAFLSTANIQGHNPDGNTFLFLADRGDSTILPVAQVAASGLLPDEVVFDMDAAGDRIAFNSKLDLVGQNPRHDWAAYLYDVPSSELHQINPPRYAARLSSMDLLGNRLALTSDGNPVQLNRDGNQEVLIWNEPSQIMEQVTRSRRALNFGGLLSSDGSQLLFISNADFTGENADRGPEVFLGSCPVEE